MIDWEHSQNTEKQSRRRSGRLSPRVKWKYVSTSRWQSKSGCGSDLISMRKLCYLFEHVQLCMRNMLAVFKGARRVNRRDGQGSSGKQTVCCNTSKKRKRYCLLKGVQFCSALIEIIIPCINGQQCVHEANFICFPPFLLYSSPKKRVCFYTHTYIYSTIVIIIRTIKILLLIPTFKRKKCFSR